MGVYRALASKEVIECAPVDKTRHRPHHGTAAVPFLLAMIPAVGWAQDINLASASFEFVPAAAINVQEGGAINPEVDFNVFRGELNVPVKLGSTVLMPGFKYAATVPGVEPQPIGGIESFHELTLSLLVIQPLSENWVLMASVAPTLATNFEDVGTDHFRVGGMAMGQYRFSRRLQVGFGVRVGYQFGELLPLPIVAVRWQPSDSFRVQAFVPALVRASFLFGNRFEIGANGRLNGNRYTLPTRDNPAIDNLAYSVGEVTGFAALRLFSRVWLTAHGGYTVFRRFEFFDADGDSLEDLELDNAPVFWTAVEWRLPGPSS